MFDDIFLDALVITFIFMNLGFIIARIIDDNSIVDVLWGLGFIAIVIGLHFLHPTKKISLISLLVTVWGVRLSLYLWIRYLKKGEDWRYAAWRKAWGKNYILRSYFQVFMLQGAMMFLIALPLFQGEEFAEINFYNLLGIILFSVGFLFESIADGQLFRFKSKPANKGKIITTGLWKYSRHPNYFGEVLVWWGIFCISIPFGYVWISVISPIVITFLLVKVSGVPMTEAGMNQRPGYADYIKRTSSFIPWFPKKNYQ